MLLPESIRENFAGLFTMLNHTYVYLTNNIEAPAYQIALLHYCPKKFPQT